MNPKEFVKEYSIKSLVACFSGGKDSLVMTHYLHETLRDSNLPVNIYVVYADTGIMLPCTEPFVKDVCQRFGWNLKIVQGNFFSHAEKYGMPRMRHRWCCWTCKIKPIADFTMTLPPQRAEAVGLRRDESVRRRKLQNMIYYLKKGFVWKYAPILFWSEKDVLRYMADNDLPMPPHYRLGLKETCMCGVYSTKKQMLILKAQFPDLFEQIVDLENHFKSGGAAFYFRNKPVHAKSLLQQKTMQDYARENEGSKWSPHSTKSSKT